MSHPQGPYSQQPYQPQPPYGQPQGPSPYPPQQYGPPQGQPAPYGQAGYGYQQPMPQHPMQTRQVGGSVTKPAWTIGQITLMVFTVGMAYPWIWAKRRRNTTITRHF